MKNLYLAFLALACQATGVLLVDPDDFGDVPRRALIMAGYLLAIAFVWKNRSSLGTLVLGVGLLLNLVVMVANGGLMPVTAARVAQAGLSHRIAGVEAGHGIPGTKNVLVQPGSARLEMLSDVVVLPRGLPSQRVVSPGDVIVVLGLSTLFVSAAVKTARRRVRVPPSPPKAARNDACLIE